MKPTFYLLFGDFIHQFGEDFGTKARVVFNHQTVSKCLSCLEHGHVTYTSGSTNIASWKMDHMKMYFLLKMGIFHCNVSLPEGNRNPEWFDGLSLSPKYGSNLPEPPEMISTIWAWICFWSGIIYNLVNRHHSNSQCIFWFRNTFEKPIPLFFDQVQAN